MPIERKLSVIIFTDIAGYSEKCNEIMIEIYTEIKISTKGVSIWQL